MSEHPYGNYCTCGKLISIEGDGEEELRLLRELETAIRGADWNWYEDEAPQRVRISAIYSQLNFLDRFRGEGRL